MLFAPINLVIFLFFEYLIDPYQRSRNNSSTESQRLEIACVQCEKKRKVIIFGKSGVEPDGSVFNASVPKCINQLQNFAYKAQDVQPNESAEHDSTLINWIAKFMYKYLRNDDSSRGCIKCQQKITKYWQDLHHTDSLYSEYIYDHIFFIYAKRLQCRNPDFERKRLKIVSSSKNGAGRLKVVRNVVNSYVAKAAITIKHKSRKKVQMTGNNRALNSLKSSIDIPLLKVFGYFSSKEKSRIFLPFRHLICSRDTKQEIQRCFSDKDKLPLHLALSSELVNAATVSSYKRKPGINFTTYHEDTLQGSRIEPTPSPMQGMLFKNDTSSKEMLSSVTETEISSTTVSSEKKSEFLVASFSLEESTLEHTSTSHTVSQSDTSSKEVLASVTETEIFSTTVSSEKKSEFLVASFSYRTLGESTLEHTSTSHTASQSDTSSKEVLASVHATDISFTTAPSEKKSGIEGIIFNQSSLEEPTLEQTPFSMHDAVLRSDTKSSEVLANIHKTGISTIAASSEKKSDFEMTSFSEDILEESTMEQTTSSIEDAIFKIDASGNEALSSIRETDIFPITASGKRSSIKVTLFNQNILEESTVEQNPSLMKDVILKSDTISKVVVASLHESGFQVTSSSQNNLKESIVEQTPSSVEDGILKSKEWLASSHETEISSTTASGERPDIKTTLSSQNMFKESTVEQAPSSMEYTVIKSYFRKGDTLALNSYSMLSTTDDELSEAKSSGTYSYMHETYSKSDAIEERSRASSQVPEDSKAQMPDRGHVIISPAAKKFGSSLLKSSYSNYMETIVEEPANGLNIEAWQKATPLLEKFDAAQLKGTLLDDLSSKSEASLQISTGIIRTSMEVKEEVEDLETESYGDNVSDSFKESTRGIEASIMQENFVPLAELNPFMSKSKNLPAVLKSKSIFGEGFEISPSYKMKSTALTEVGNDHKLLLSPTKYNRLPSSKVLEKPLSKVEIKEDSLDSLEENSVKKLSESRLSISSQNERTLKAHGISMSRANSEIKNDMFLLSSTQIKFVGQPLLHDVTAKHNDIDASMTYSETHDLPKNIHIDARRIRTKVQQLVDTDASSKLPESKVGDEQWKKEDLEGEIVAKKISANIEINAEKNIFLSSSEVNEKEIVKASESTESNAIGTKKVEMNSDELETKKLMHSDVLTREAILLRQVENPSRRNITLTDSEIKSTTIITTNAMSVDPTYEQESEEALHLRRKADDLDFDSSKLYGIEDRIFDDAFSFEDSYNGSLVAPIINLKEIEEGKIFVLSPDFVILLTLLILVFYKQLRRSLQRFSPSRGGDNSNYEEKPLIETVTTKFDIFMAPGGEIKFEMKQEFKVS